MTDRVAPNPFPGYRPFDVPDAAWYFGRESEAQALEARLVDARMLAVIGAPEVGKSSLVRAGVIPAVRQRGWRVAILRPGEDPVGNLARALGAPEALGVPAHDLERLLRSGPGGLADALRAGGVAPGHDLLVVVDQLDELFRYRRCRELLDTAPDDGRFVELLVGGHDRELRIRTLLTMRADSIEACGGYPALLDAVQREPFELPALTGEQLRHAIEAPISAAGARISPTLVTAIVEAFEPARVPGQLPLIQHALMRAWDARKDSGDELTLRLYESIGGLHRALFMHADEVCDRDPRPELVDLVVRAITSFVDGEFVPRPASIGEIARMADTSVDEVEGVVGRLQAPGVTFLKPPATGTLGERSVVDVSYDSFGWLRRHRWAHRTLPVVTPSRESRAKLPARGGGFWAAGRARLAWAAPLALILGVALALAGFSLAWLPFAASFGLAVTYNWPFVRRHLWPVLLMVSTLTLLALLFGSQPTGPIPPSLPFCGALQTLVARGDGTWVCTDPPRCPAGQSLVAASDGTWQCTDVPQQRCQPGQILVARRPDGVLDCTNAPLPNCLDGQILVTRPGGVLECSNTLPQQCPEDETLVAGPGGVLECGPFPPGQPLSPTCDLGQVLVGVQGGKALCQPVCPDGQTFLPRRDGNWVCTNSPPPRCEPEQILVARQPDGVLECSNTLPQQCPQGETLVAGPGGVLKCGPFPSVKPAPLRCDPGQVLVGVENGEALCQPLPLAPSIQFDNLPRAAPGFVYRLQAGGTDIEELDLRISITPASREVVVEGFRSRAVLLSATLDQLERETPFRAGAFGYTLKLSPAAGGWSAVIRRCWGACPARP